MTPTELLVRLVTFKRINSSGLCHIRHHSLFQPPPTSSFIFFLLHLSFICPSVSFFHSFSLPLSFTLQYSCFSLFSSFLLPPPFIFFFLLPSSFLVHLWDRPSKTWRSCICSSPPHSALSTRLLLSFTVASASSAVFFSIFRVLKQPHSRTFKFTNDSTAGGKQLGSRKSISRRLTSLLFSQTTARLRVCFFPSYLKQQKDFMENRAIEQKGRALRLLFACTSFSGTAS